MRGTENEAMIADYISVIILAVPLFYVAVKAVFAFVARRHFRMLRDMVRVIRNREGVSEADLAYLRAMLDLATSPYVAFISNIFTPLVFLFERDGAAERMPVDLIEGVAGGKLAAISHAEAEELSARAALCAQFSAPFSAAFAFVTAFPILVFRLGLDRATVAFSRVQTERVEAMLTRLRPRGA